jgi:hypothetical protein
MTMDNNTEMIYVRDDQTKLMLHYLKKIKPSRRDYFRLSQTQRQQR